MYSAIDIGSNTIQLLICNVQNGRLTERRNYLRTTRLGAGGRGVLPAEAIADTAAAIAEFMALIRLSRARQVKITATSAVRDAANSEELREAIRTAAPEAPEIEIISGLREAALAYGGARASLDFPWGWPVADSGGSSTELIYMVGGAPRCVSADVGAVRAVKNGWTREQIGRLLAEAYGNHAHKMNGLVGVGGSITTAAGLQLGLTRYERDAIEGTVLKADDLEAWAARLAPLSVEQRRALSPLLAERGEIIVAGLWIWLALLSLLEVDRVAVTGGGVLDGAVAEMAGLNW